MASKNCSACSGTGERSFVGGSSANYEHCPTCDGTGRVQYYEPVSKPVKPISSTSNNGTQTMNKQKKPVNSKSIRIGWSIAAFVAGYFFFTALVLDNLYISGAVGLVAFMLMYKWYKILAPIILLGLLGFGIYSIFG